MGAHLQKPDQQTVPDRKIKGVWLWEAERDINRASALECLRSNAAMQMERGGEWEEEADRDIQPTRRAARDRGKW